jgi:chemotaxis family two-component system sensor kinase Cph1
VTADPAKATVPQPDNEKIVPLDDCASEPIRVPGAIQPFGYLLAFETRTRLLQHASANVAMLIGKSIGELLGHPFTDWLSPADAAALVTAIGAFDPHDPDARTALDLNGQALVSRVHLMGDLSIVELEPATAEQAAAQTTNEPMLARALRRLQSASDLATLREVAVREIRALTGCDRVVVYAFGANGDGRVLTEAKSDEVASYLGLSFPASDIPAQARELYRLNWMRMIPDVDYEPVPIIGLDIAPQAAPLDLTFSTLRSVSPVHREYMRHMGSRSSISISLLRGGDLWGLISCVHREPKALSPAIRSACLSIGRLLSLQISALESLQESRHLAANQGLLAPIVEEMRGSSQEVFESLARVPRYLTALPDAQGAAIVVGETITRIGTCPSELQVRELSRWAVEHAITIGHFATSSLPLEYEPAQSFADVASGLLVIMLPKPMLSMVMWFRPEVTQTVEWAGDPRKAAALLANTAGGTGDDSNGGRLSPRHSFDTWKTLSKHRAISWAEHQIQAAYELRRYAIELDLAAQVRRAQAAVESRDELVAVVSHDLRSPLSVVSIQASMLIRTLVSDTSAASRRIMSAANSIQRATTRMAQMLDDLLDLSAIERGRYRVEMEPHRLESILEDSKTLLSPIAENKRIALNFSCDTSLIISADAERLYQVISNLVGNALKFTPPGGSVDVHALPDPKNPAMVLFAVADTGIGMSTEQIAHIFERYWRVRDAIPKGSGLGLYIASGIVEAHGGKIWAESTLGTGTTFYFTVPLAKR